MIRRLSNFLLALAYDPAPIRLRKLSLFRPDRFHSPFPHLRTHILVAALYSVKRTSARSSASRVSAATAGLALRFPSTMEKAAVVDLMTLEWAMRASVEMETVVASASRGTG